jgi:hypothetical protein
MGTTFFFQLDGSFVRAMLEEADTLRAQTNPRWWDMGQFYLDADAMYCGYIQPEGGGRP